MSKAWDSSSRWLLVERKCAKETCERVFKTLPKSDLKYCCKQHDPNWEWEKETCFTKGAYRGGRDLK